MEERNGKGMEYSMQSFVFFLIDILFIYLLLYLCILAAWGLSCSTRESLLQHVESLVVTCGLLRCGMQTLS